MKQPFLEKGIFMRSLTSEASPHTEERQAAKEYFSTEGLRERRAALVIAHPGHELRVHHWMELARPRVYVFTDGSGHTGKSRLGSTTGLLARAGARPGSIYGRFKDADIYRAILESNVNLFIELAGELAEALVRESVEYVVGDAIEGYNPTHDLCRGVINTGVQLANNSGAGLANFEFVVAGQPDSLSSVLEDEQIRVLLDEAALERKLAAAGAYLELSDYVNKVATEIGIDSLRVETFRAVSTEVRDDIHEPPFYEQYGEKQVADGHYDRVIRYREHILPLMRALRGNAKR
jgi:hypothetical protein